jgi:hypothetical protein
MLGQVSRTLGPVGVVLAWLAAVVAATFVGVLAVGAIGGDIVPQAQPPLSPEEIRQQLASAAPTTTSSTRSADPEPEPTTPTPTSSSSSPAPVVPKSLSSPGGVVYARCDPRAESGVEIVSIAPAQGYHLEDDEEEDGGRRVRFESGDSKVELQITCANGVPRAAVSNERSGDNDDD